MANIYIEPSDLEALDQVKLKQAITALESGKYEQHTGGMTSVGEPHKACCLMVIAQEVDGIKHDDAIRVYDRSFDEKGHESHSFPTDIKRDKVPFAIACENLEVHYHDGNFETDSLAVANDEYLTHPQIADLLKGKTVTAFKGDNNV